MVTGISLHRVYFESKARLTRNILIKTALKFDTPFSINDSLNQNVSRMLGVGLSAKRPGMA